MREKLKERSRQKYTQCVVGHERTSMRPVYMRIPELQVSRIPLTMLAVVLPGLYVVLTPIPTMIPRGVVMP